MTFLQFHYHHGSAAFAEGTTITWTRAQYLFSGSKVQRPTLHTTAWTDTSKQAMETKLPCTGKAELLKMVCRIANYMKSIGIKKGDDVTIYMPMVVELPAAMVRPLPQHANLLCSVSCTYST